LFGSSPTVTKLSVSLCVFDAGHIDFIFKDTFLLIIHLKKLVKFINATFTGSVLVPNATLADKR
jgi:hypothetical protein